VHGDVLVEDDTDLRHLAVHKLDRHAREQLTRAVISA
jgi:hypothetical protein